MEIVCSQPSLSHSAHRTCTTLNAAKINGSQWILKTFYSPSINDGNLSNRAWDEIGRRILGWHKRWLLFRMIYVLCLWRYSSCVLAIPTNWWINCGKMTTFWMVKEQKCCDDCVPQCGLSTHWIATVLAQYIAMTLTDFVINHEHSGCVFNVHSADILMRYQRPLYIPNIYSEIRIGVPNWNEWIWMNQTNSSTLNCACRHNKRHFGMTAANHQSIHCSCCCWSLSHFISYLCSAAYFHFVLFTARQ